MRGLRTELDLRNDSAWGRQLASIRADISSALQSEIDSVPGRVRRLLRQRSDKDMLFLLPADVFRTVPFGRLTGSAADYGLR